MQVWDSEGGGCMQFDAGAPDAGASVGGSGAALGTIVENRNLQSALSKRLAALGGSVQVFDSVAVSRVAPGSDASAGADSTERPALDNFALVELRNQDGSTRQLRTRLLVRSRSPVCRCSSIPFRRADGDFSLSTSSDRRRRRSKSRSPIPRNVVARFRLQSAVRFMRAVDVVYFHHLLDFIFSLGNYCSGVVATVRTKTPHATAFQRFLPTGPLAVLPVRAHTSLRACKYFFHFLTDGLSNSIFCLFKLPAVVRFVQLNRVVDESEPR
jgi:hypothetical protein